jgi:hypothetical protein
MLVGIFPSSSGIAGMMQDVFRPQPAVRLDIQAQSSARERAKA